MFRTLMTATILALTVIAAQAGDTVTVHVGDLDLTRAQDAQTSTPASKPRPKPLALWSSASTRKRLPITRGHPELRQTGQQVRDDKISVHGQGNGCGALPDRRQISGPCLQALGALTSQERPGIFLGILTLGSSDTPAPTA